MEDDESLLPVPAAESEEWTATAHTARVARYMLDDLLDPAPSSALASSDSDYPWEKCSAWVRSYLLASCEHLILWANVVSPLEFPEGMKVANYPRPYYALARAGLESACQAVWILRQESSAERTFRHLILVYHDLRHMALSLEAEEDPRVFQARDRMNLLKERVGGGSDFKAIKDGEPTFKALVRECSSVVDLDPGEMEAMWRLASAATHGKNWFQFLSGRFEVGEEFEPEYFRATLVPDPARVTKVMAAASNMALSGVLQFGAAAGLDYRSAYDRAFTKLMAEVPLKGPNPSKDR